MTDTLYCPACRLDVAPLNGACPYCDGLVRRRIKGPGPGHLRRVTYEEIRIFHRLHVEHGVSLREIGRALVRQGRYASEGSAGTALGAHMRRFGLQVRDRSEATAKSNVDRRAPDSPGTADRKEYKRWLREKQGGYRPCQGVKLSAPEAGRPCRRFAAPGSAYCRFHDPIKRAEVVDLTIRMRSHLELAS